MSTLIAVATGSLFVGGVVAFSFGLRRRPLPSGTHRTAETLSARWSRLTRRPSGRRGRNRDRLLVLGVVIGLLGYLATGWALLLALAPVLILALPYLLGDPPNAEADMLSSLDRWVRAMAANLQTGQSISDALRLSAKNPPPLLAEEVRLLVARIEHRWPLRDALKAMGDALDTPDADAVLAALALAAHRGGTGATATLDALSDSVQERLRALREIDAERAKPRVVVRQVTVISVVVFGLALLFGGEFFAPYRSGIGQVILAALLCIYFASLLGMRRITAPPRRQRILQEAGR
ncbi:type II secretion system F family protein [Granulicoccus sp. GXG6511]|uniref:type II secretion system F family protein n=1 Tax=Granulicoccus sp. GXG6511 TaxID=3381351 RepID=UPI003D7CCF7C